MQILQTENQEWGFWGTCKESQKSKKVRQEEWNKAFTIIQENAGFTPLETLALLDSRWGRHVADEFAEELSVDAETFSKAFKRKMTKDRLYKEYNYYVDPYAYKPKKSYRNENFCKDLKKLSKLYGVTLKVVGGVGIHGQETMKKFKGYSTDLESGDLMPIWEDSQFKLGVLPYRH